MDDPPRAAPLDELIAQAQDTHVIVIGAGIGGLVAALSCAKIGIRVTVVEASDRLGGTVHTAQVGGVPVDLGAEGYATRGGAVRALVDEVALGDAVVVADLRADWIAGLPTGSAPVPVESVCGIPENPWDERVRRIIGWRGTWRAYVDRLRPPLTIGQERSLGRLVRSRMGERVLDRLVAPLSLGGFGIHPDDVDVEIAAPGLSNALTRTGSLAGAVAQVRAAAVPPETEHAGMEGIEGGMSRLVDALHSRLVGLGTQVIVGTRVAALEELDDGRWAVVADADAADAADRGDASDPGTAAVTSALDPADAIIVATDAPEAHRLLAAVVPSLELPSVTQLEVVTIVVSSPELAAGPARTAVYPVAGYARAAQVTDATARWPWLRRAAGEGVRVLKVTFGGPGITPATAGLDDSAATDLALAEASALLDVRLDPAAVRGAHRARYAQPAPTSALGRREAVDAARAAIHGVAGVAAVGASVAGTGLAQASRS